MRELTDQQLFAERCKMWAWHCADKLHPYPCLRMGAIDRELTRRGVELTPWYKLRYPKEVSHD